MNTHQTVQADWALRTAQMRERLVRDDRERPPGKGPLPVIEARSLQASEGQPWQIRRAQAVRDCMAARRFVLHEYEMIVGRPFADLEFTPAEGAAARQCLQEHHPWPGGQTGHCELDLGPILREGIDGVAATIRARRDRAEGERREAYESFLIVLDGLGTLLRNAADAAGAAQADASQVRRRELERMRQACLHVAHHPPRTMAETLQLFWAIWLGSSWDDHAGCINLGHLDRWLWPFYQADLAAGRIDRDVALHLLEQLYLLVNACWPQGSAIAAMVGGRDAQGRDVTNELSFLSLEALRRTRLAYPTVGICWHEGTPPELVDLAMELVAEGIVTPAFFGDEVIQRGLRALGVPADQAAWYINSSCVEITPAGSSNVWVASPYYSMPRLLLEEIEAQVASGEPAGDFEGFLSAYLTRVERAVAQGVAHQNELRRRRQQTGRHPLQSVFTRDCIERGRDIDDGGARYNWVECSFVGLPNITDSLEVLRREVFERRAMTLAEVKAVLDADFAGAEPIRRRWLDRLPKYGQGDNEVDALFGRIVAELQRICRGHRMEPDGAPYLPGAFCWIQHERLGGQCPATPDGRRAGTAFADGCGPAQGRETRGPTAAVLSVTSWDHSPMIGGLAYNMKFSRSLLAQADARAKLRELVLTYLRRGGFETQINVVDREVLMQARQHPEAYRDLVVRIGGYTDYFTRLEPGMQDEVIARAELGL